jgi:hypothetical protein
MMGWFLEKEPFAEHQNRREYRGSRRAKLPPARAQSGLLVRGCLTDQSTVWADIEDRIMRLNRLWA